MTRMLVPAAALASVLLLAGCAAGQSTKPVMKPQNPSSSAPAPKPTKVPLATIQDLQAALLTDADLDAAGFTTVGVPKPGGQTPSPLSVEYPKSDTYTPECSIISGGRLLTPAEYAAKSTDSAPVLLPDPGADYNSDRGKQITLKGRVFPSVDAANKFLEADRAALSSCPSWDDSATGNEYPVSPVTLSGAGDSVAWISDFGGYQELVAFLRVDNVVASIDLHNNLDEATKETVVGLQATKLAKVAHSG